MASITIASILQSPTGPKQLKICNLKYFKPFEKHG